MGLELDSPIVVSACPLSEKIENIVRMENSGAGAVVLFSLFEEQIKQEIANYNSMLDATSNTFPEALLDQRFKIRLIINHQYPGHDPISLSFSLRTGKSIGFVKNPSAPRFMAVLLFSSSP